MQQMHFLSRSHSEFRSLPVCAGFRSAYGKLEFSTTLFARAEVLAALARRSSGSTRPHTDAATTVWVCIFVEYSAALAVLDFLEQEMYFLSCANSDFCSLPVC